MSRIGEQRGFLLGREKPPNGYRASWYQSDCIERLVLDRRCLAVHIKDMDRRYSNITHKCKSVCSMFTDAAHLQVHTIIGTTLPVDCLQPVWNSPVLVLIVFTHSKIRECVHYNSL